MFCGWTLCFVVRRNIEVFTTNCVISLEMYNLVVDS